MDSIIGTWKLLSYELKKEGKVIFPLGKKVNGLLLYQENGFMSGIISGENRPNVTKPATMGIPDNERLEISKNFIAYSGKYCVDNDKIIHSIEVSFIPNLIGDTSHFGIFELKGNNLVIKSTPLSLKEIIVEVTWVKV